MQNVRDTFLVIALKRETAHQQEGQYLLQKSKDQLLAALEYDNQQLRSMLYFKRLAPLTLVAAEVIARSPENWFMYMTLDRGTRDGIKVGQPVVNEEGLVGKIVEVGPDHSKLLAITAPQSKINVVDIRTGDQGIIVGRLHHPLIMNYVENTAQVTPGETIYTSGISTTFPKGIPVGIIKSVHKEKYNVFQRVEVIPIVRLSALQHVFIITEKKEKVLWPEKK